jgi:tRNA A-37 threonylcarbamoyl transferase component Bud32
MIFAAERRAPGVSLESVGTGKNDGHSRALLKDGLHRQVLVERDPGGDSRVVKRYQSKGLMRRMLDGRRARREHQLLLSLWRDEVPVPRPLGLRSSGGAWELSTELLEGAVTLHELLEGRAPLPAHPVLLASAIGRTLAAAHASGLDHRDLHAGNLMLDEQARAWLVDFGSASRRKALGAGALMRDLVSLAAATRERVPVQLRQRALLSWVRALPAEYRAALPPTDQLAASVERSARERRARVLVEHRDRWLRVSGRCQRVDQDTLVTRLQPHDQLLLERIAASELDPAARELSGSPDLEAQLFEGGEDLRQSFAELGRAYEHALPALRPLVLRGGPPWRAACSAPRGSRPLLDGETPDPAQLALLRALLSDRALSLDWASLKLWQTPDGALLLGPGVRLGLSAARDHRGGGCDG